MMRFKILLQSIFPILIFISFYVNGQTPPKSMVVKQKANIQSNIDAATIPLSMQTEMSKFNFMGDEIWIYKNINFSGDKKVLKIGRFNLASLGNDWNDVAMSCLIPVNYKVDFFTENNFQGNYLRLVGILRPTDFKLIGTQNFSRLTVGEVFSNGGEKLRFKDFIHFESTSSIIVSKN